MVKGDNMREIKFRAWSTQSKRIFPVRRIQFEPDRYSNDGYVWLESSQNPSDDGQVDITLVNLMQYTGLKDKNGKEIYEGDIVRHHLRDNAPFVGDTEFSVSWYKNGWHLSWADGISQPFECPEFYEVIGNIYENPELLENEQNQVRTK